MATDSKGQHGLYACMGTLYLVDVEVGVPLQKIDAGWWFEDLASYAWSAAGSELNLVARYITGIGPTGTVPFAVVFRIVQADTGTWTVEQLEPAGADYEVEPDGMVEIKNSAQLAALTLRERDRPFTPDVNFDQDRLIVKSVWLT